MTCNGAVSLVNAAKFCTVDDDRDNCNHLIHSQSNHNSAYDHDSDNYNCMMNHRWSHSDSHDIDSGVVRKYCKACEEAVVALLDDHSRNDNRSSFLIHNHCIGDHLVQYHCHEDVCEAGSVYLHYRSYNNNNNGMEEACLVQNDDTLQRTYREIYKKVLSNVFI